MIHQVAHLLDQREEEEARAKILAAHLSVEGDRSRSTGEVEGEAAGRDHLIGESRSSSSGDWEDTANA